MAYANSFPLVSNLNSTALGVPGAIPAASAAVGSPPRAAISNRGSVSQVIADIRSVTDDWPRSVGGTLFIDDPKLGIHYFDRQGVNGLFGWLQSQGEVRWEAGSTLASKAEVFAELQRTATRYRAIELLPHEPRVDGVYYRGALPESGDGSKLRALIGRFNAETDIDRTLIQAAFMTPFWGGLAGARPVFMIASDAGRGVGKSKLAEAISFLCGGHFDVSTGADIEQVKTRMLTPAARTKRLAIIDNVKTMKLSSAELEAIITSPVISGKQLYSGEGEAPNLRTWIITLNGPSLGTDMAQRVVTIKLAKPKYDGTWLEDTFEFIDRYRSEIIADIIGALRAEPQELVTYSRWGAWETGVLAKLPNPEEARNVIQERQGLVNVELDEAEIIEEFFAEQLDQFGYDSMAMEIRIPVSITADWIKKATGDSRMATATATRRLRQMVTEGQIKRLYEDPSRTNGRCFIWSGEDADPFAEKENDLRERISQYEKCWRS